MDDDTYWLPCNDDKTALTKLPEARIVGQMMKSNNGKFTIDLANSGDVVAFFVRMKVVRTTDREIVTPVFFDDNYIVLLPGEKKSIIVDTSMLTEENKSTPLVLLLEGINLPVQVIRL
jgi:mannosylglycoprotein endo-beta-mannosidase